MQKQLKKPEREAATDTEPAESPAATEKGVKLKATIDDILDGIDDMLEQNAEAFVKAYVQRGGQ